VKKGESEFQNGMPAIIIFRKKLCQVWWLVTVILPIWEAEIWRTGESRFEAQPMQIVFKTPFPK
jgi:hypothetical protein